MDPLNQSGFRNELNDCLIRLKNLADSMDLADRMVFINEVVIRLLPERKKSKHAQAKAAENTRSPLQGLTSEQLGLIRKLSDATDRLSGFNEGQAAC